MARSVLRCNGLHPLDRVTRGQLDEGVVLPLGPVHREADDHKRPLVERVLGRETEWIGVAHARPDGEKRLQDEGPDQAFDFGGAERGDGVAVDGVNGGESSRVVSDSRGGEDLAPAGGVKHVHLVGRAGERAGFAGAPEAPDGVEGRGFPACGPVLVLWAFSIGQVHGDKLDTERLDVGEAGDRTGSVLVVLRGGVTGVFPTDTFVECGEGLGGFGGSHVEEAAPDFGAGKATRRKARDDAEVVGAAFEGTPEVGVGGF